MYKTTPEIGTPPLIRTLLATPRVSIIERFHCTCSLQILYYDDTVLSSVDKLLLRKAPGGTDASVRFAVHIRMGSYSQISIFQLFLINSQLVLRPLNNYTCPMVSTLLYPYFIFKVFCFGEFKNFVVLTKFLKPSLVVCTKFSEISELPAFC